MNKDIDHIQAVPNDAQRGHLPALLQQVKDNSISILSAHMENLFNSCDDLFFDLSSRAASNAEQNLYFESMREVRLKKNGVIANFKTELNSNFHQLSATPTQSNLTQPQDSQATHHSNLSLVQNDALEQDVAISGMVTKARISCQESLYHLNLRFDYLTPNTTITDQNNPMDPQQICRDFAKACELLELNIKAQIILFKQFDRFVASKLATVYSSANNLLIEAGVLPNIKEHIQSKSTTQNQSTRSQSSQQQATEHHIELEFAELSNLFNSIRQQAPDLLSQLIPNYTTYTANLGPVLSNEELFKLLTYNQQHIASNSEQNLQLNKNLHQIINNILSEKGNSPDRSLQQSDDDIINLVAMFFDFVLDDKNLPIAIQALIGRLQIPVLKIALHDKKFFSNSAHPTRKLINAIAAASIGWDDSTQLEKDRLYALISKITHDINEQYTNNTQIFSDKLLELHNFTEKTEHKSILIEKRTEQAAEGQAKTKLAKIMSQQALLEKMEAVTLPEPVSEFLTQHWLQCLVISHLKHGDESPEWTDAVQLIDDLIWASQKHPDIKSQERFQKIKPQLLEKISIGINKIADSSDSAKNIFAKVESALANLESESDHSMANRPLSAEQARELGHTPGGGSKAWKDMTGIERQQARYKQLTYEYIRKAEQLPIHTWIAYNDPQTGKIIRCKYAVHIKQSDTFVFVNRFGFKALEKARKDFACDLQTGRAEILENGQLFDRAMSNVLSKLHKATGTPSPS